jgi:hypothetical protein
MMRGLARGAPTARRGNLRRRNRFLATMALLLGLIVGAGLPGFTSTASASISKAGRGPKRIIIDTDLSRWWDDTTALGMANVLQQRGKVQILGVMSDIRNPVAAAASDAIDTAYGHGRIPVGAVADSSANTAPHGYSDVLAAHRRNRRSASTVICWRPSRTTV